MRFVAIKTETQRDPQTPRRSRDRRLGERSALINPFRAIRLARGIINPRGKRKRERDRVMLREEREAGPLTARMLVADMRARWRERDRRIAAFVAAFVAIAKESDEARQLATIPGVGVMTATARIAAIGKAARAALPHGAEQDTPLGRRAKERLARVDPNVAVVALANKLARIASVVPRYGQHFTAKEAPMTASPSARQRA